MTEDGQSSSVLSICKLFPQKAPEFFQIRIAEHRQDLHQLFWLQIPPLIAQQQIFQLRVKSLLDESRRVSAVNSVRRNILHHHGIGGDDRAVANLHAGHDDALAPDPHVVSDDRVALARKLRHVRRRILRPGAAENVEWIRRGAADAVVRRTHDKLRAGRDLTELADHKMIAELRVVEQHIVPLKPRRIDRIVIIGVVTDRDIRRSDDVLDEARGLVFIRKDRIRVRNIHHYFALSGCFSITKFVSATPWRITSCLRTTWYPRCWKNSFAVMEACVVNVFPVAKRSNSSQIADAIPCP